MNIIFNIVSILVLIVAVILLSLKKKKEEISEPIKRRIKLPFIYLFLSVALFFVPSLFGSLVCTKGDVQCAIIDIFVVGGISVLAGVVLFAISIARFISYFRFKKHNKQSHE